MNTAENIRNAVLVLYKTYESINKLLDECKMIAEDKGYVLAVDKFLRWKSDPNPNGWLLNSFILLFQKASDPECISGNNWRNGPIFALEVFLGDRENPEALPQLFMSKFTYEDLNNWEEGCSSANHWAFYQPIHLEGMDLFTTEQKQDICVSRPRSEKISKNYWGLGQVLFLSHPLIDVNSDNLGSIVLDSFDRLADLDSEHD